MSFQVTLPVFAQHDFHGGAETYGIMTAAMGAGAVVGGLMTAARGRTGLRALALAAVTFGFVLFFAAVAPVLAAGFRRACPGWVRQCFVSLMANSTLQLETEPQMRGRVMALWSVAFQDQSQFGGPAIGWITAAAGAWAGLGVGALSCFVAAGLGLVAIRHFHDNTGGNADGDVGAELPPQSSSPVTA